MGPRRAGHPVASSSGVVIGQVKKLLHGRKPVLERSIDPHMVESEVARLLAAIEAAGQAIDVERNHLIGAGIKDLLMILDMHHMLVADPELLAKSSARIRNDCINAEWALRQELDAIQVIFEQIEDEYLRNRSDDIEHVGRRILDHLTDASARHGQSTETSYSGQDGEEKPVIYVGDDFSVADVVSMWRCGVAGIATELGGADAHNIIVARGIGLPAMVGAVGILDDIEDGNTLILDAEQDVWILNPTSDEETAYVKFREAVSSSKKELQAFAGKPSLSTDGHELKLMANIEFPEELGLAEDTGIDGIGLYRSEFLFIDESTMPDEQYQYEQYVSLVRRMHGKPVTMRLLDIGGDRPWLYSDLAGHDYGGANPALGLRGVRLLLRNPEILKTQLCAMIRAADEGPVRILAPMVTNTEEMERIRDMAEQCRVRLGVTESIPLGAMIEVPATALIAADMARVSDFFSIGSNDLMQYALAVDRNDEEVAELYQPDHCAVLELIKLTAMAAKKAGIPVSICGELATNPEWTATFLNLDMEYLSMSSSNILAIRRCLSRQTYKPMLQ
ncbi:MAG: phosphoenolpyruvate--protein phosphotransferase [Mariprofundus sp.]